MIVHIKSETTEHTLRVHVDGVYYRVVHIIHTGETGRIGLPSDYWRVFGSRGAYAERQCDPDKATFKRVVAAVVEALAQRRIERETAA